MPKITISYRRADSQDITGRIFDRLVSYYGRDFVFRDIDSIRPGIDFRDQISEALQTANVLLVVMGPKWAGRMKGSEARIDNDADPVRIEVETALGRKIPIIPVLVGGAAMPTTAQLPDSLRDFAYRQAVAIDGGRDFDIHLNRLTRAVDDLLAMQARAAKTAKTQHVTPPPVAPAQPAPVAPMQVTPAQPHPDMSMQPPPLTSVQPPPPRLRLPPMPTIRLPPMPTIRLPSLPPLPSLQSIQSMLVWPRPLWLGGGAAIIILLLVGAWIGLRKPDVPGPAIADKSATVNKLESVVAPKSDVKKTLPPDRAAKDVALPSRMGSPIDDGTPVNIGDSYDKLLSVYKDMPEPKSMPVGDQNLDRYYLEDDGIEYFLKGKTVAAIHLVYPWRGTVRGVKIGDTSERVMSLLGTPAKTEERNSRTVLTYRWPGMYTVEFHIRAANKQVQIVMIQ